MLTNKLNSEFNQKEDSENVTTLIINNNNIEKINNYLSYKNLEYLSLQNNNIKDILFIENFPLLWYLDIRNNPIENFEILNNKITYGFLGITLNNKNSIDFLRLNNLRTGFLFLDFHEIEENKILESISKNPNYNIFKINNVFNNIINENISENFELELIYNENKSNLKVKLLHDFFNKQKKLMNDLKDLKSKEAISIHNSFINNSHSISNIEFDSHNDINKILFLLEKEKLLMNLKLINTFIQLKKNINSNLNIQSFSMLNDPITDFLYVKNDNIYNFEFDLNIFTCGVPENKLIKVIILALLILKILDKDLTYLLLQQLIIREDIKELSNNYKQQNLKLFLNFKLETQITFYYQILQENKNLNFNDHLKNSVFNNQGELEELLDILEMRSVLIQYEDINAKNNIFSRTSFFEEKYEKEKDQKLLKDLVKEEIIKPIKAEFKFLEEVAILIDIIKTFFNKINFDLINLDINDMEFDSYINEEKKNFNNIFILANSVVLKYFKRKYIDKKLITKTNFFAVIKYPNLSKNVISKIMLNNKKDLIEDNEEIEEKNLINYFNNEKNFFEEIKDNKYCNKLNPIKNRCILIKSNAKKINYNIEDINNKNFSINPNMHEISTSYSFNTSNKNQNKQIIKFNLDDNFSSKKTILIGDQLTSDKRDKYFLKNRNDSNKNSNNKNEFKLNWKISNLQLDNFKADNNCNSEYNIQTKNIRQRLKSMPKLKKRRINEINEPCILSPFSNN